MSGQCLRFILPPDMTAKQKEEYENCMFGVDSVVLLAILMAVMYALGRLGEPAAEDPQLSLFP